MTKEPRSANKIPDKFLVVFSLILALFLNLFNNVPTPVLLKRGTFYRDLLIAFILSMVVIVFIQRISSHLDERYPWEDEPKIRIGLQFLLGVVVPGIMVYLLCLLQYYTIVPDHVVGTNSFWSVEFPVILVFITLANVIIALVYFYGRAQQTNRSNFTKHVAAPQTITVTQGNNKVLLSVDDIALIRLDHDISKIFAKNGQTYIGERSLSSYVKILDTNLFFRANRQSIVNRDSCYSYRSAEYGKISVELTSKDLPPINISQKRAASFRSWIAEPKN